MSSTHGRHPTHRWGLSPIRKPRRRATPPDPKIPEVPVSGAGITAPAGPPGHDQGQAKPRLPTTAQGPRRAGPCTPTAPQKPADLPRRRHRVGALGPVSRRTKPSGSRPCRALSVRMEPEAPCPVVAWGDETEGAERRPRGGRPTPLGGMWASKPWWGRLCPLWVPGGPPTWTALTGRRRTCRG